MISGDLELPGIQMLTAGLDWTVRSWRQKPTPFPPSTKGDSKSGSEALIANITIISTMVSSMALLSFTH